MISYLRELWADIIDTTGPWPDYVFGTLLLVSASMLTTKLALGLDWSVWWILGVFFIPFGIFALFWFLLWLAFSTIKY